MLLLKKQICHKILINISTVKLSKFPECKKKSPFNSNLAWYKLSFDTKHQGKPNNSTINSDVTNLASKPKTSAKPILSCYKLWCY